MENLLQKLNIFEASECSWQNLNAAGLEGVWLVCSWPYPVLWILSKAFGVEWNSIAWTFRDLLNQRYWWIFVSTLDAMMNTCICISLFTNPRLPVLQIARNG